MRLINLMFVALLAISCGKDDGGGGGDGNGDGDGDIIDANNGGGDGDGDGDASTGTGQGPGQFCNTQPDGGPACMDGLECCADKVCRTAGDCGGSTGFIPCDCNAPDCSSSFLCCDAPDMTFCTKRSACNDVGGTICE